MDPSQEEKRSYTRVNARLTARARVVESGEDPLFRQAPIGSARMEENLTGNLPESVVDFLRQMDEKLDRLLGLLGSNELDAYFPLRLDITEISGAGLRLIPSDGIKEGMLLEVVVTLSYFPYRLAGAIGRVVDHDENGQLGFAFTHIRETDLEEIIRFVFQEQRESIRSSKWA